MTSRRNVTASNRDAVNRRPGRVSEKESAARAALQACIGCTLSDLDWDSARERLIEFATILRVWQLGGERN